MRYASNMFLTTAVLVRFFAVAREMNDAILSLTRRDKRI